MGPTPQELLSQARDAASNNENKKAEVLLKQILVEQPSNKQSRLLLADVYLAQGRYESAIKEFTAYAKLTETPKPVEGIAKSYFFSQKYEDVIQYLDQFEPDLLGSESLLLLSLADARLGNQQKHNSTNKIIIKNHSGSLEAEYVLLEERFSKGDIDASQKQLTQLLQEHPNNPHLILLQAEVLFKQRDFSGSAEWFEKHLDISKNNIRSIILLAQSYFEIEEYSAIERHVTPILEIAPDVPSLNFFKSIARYEENDFEQAYEHAERVLRKGIEEPILLNISALSAINLEKYPIAIRRLSRLVDLRPEKESFKTLLEQVKIEAGQSYSVLDETLSSTSSSFSGGTLNKAIFDVIGQSDELDTKVLELVNRAKLNTLVKYEDDATLYTKLFLSYGDKTTTELVDLAISDRLSGAQEALVIPFLIERGAFDDLSRYIDNNQGEINENLLASKAYIALQENDIKRAEELVKSIKEKWPKSNIVAVFEAQQYALSERYEEATKTLVAAIQNKPTKQLFELLFTYAEKTDRTDFALKETKYLLDNNNYPAIESYYLSKLSDYGRHSVALKHVKAALSTSKNISPKLALSYARVFLQNNQHNEAFSILSDNIKDGNIDIATLRLYSGVGGFLQKSSDVIEDLSEVVSKQPQYDKAQYLLLDNLFETKRYESLINHMTTFKLEENAQRDAIYAFYWAASHEQINELDEALVWMQVSYNLSASAKNTAYLYRLLQQQKPNSLDSFVKKHLKLNPQDKATAMVHSLNLTANNRLQEALALLKLSLDYYPNDVNLRALEVKLLLGNGKTEQAYNRASEIVEQKPSPIAVEALAEAIFHKKQYVSLIEKLSPFESSFLTPRTKELLDKARQLTM